MAITKLTQLTAPGVTSAIKVSNDKNHTIQYKVASITTNVIVRAEGSLDGTNFFPLFASDTTITADGTYFLNIVNTPLQEIRFRFVSEAGGTNATIDTIIMSTL